MIQKVLVDKEFLDSANEKQKAILSQIKMQLDTEFAIEHS